jgi:hypothetical protein
MYLTSEAAAAASTEKEEAIILRSGDLLMTPE